MVNKGLYALIVFALAGSIYAWFVPRSFEKKVTTVSAEKINTAVFAGGCFWCTEADFEKLEGVIEAVSGYMGGTAETATYEATSNKTTDHREVVKVVYDASQLTFKDLAAYHLKHIDPTDNKGQFVDRGYVYSPAIFYATPFEQAAAEAALAELNRLGVFSAQVAIPIEAIKTFYRAEEHHQDYYLKNPIRYQYYRNGSGRTDFLTTTWN